MEGLQILEIPDTISQEKSSATGFESLISQLHDLKPEPTTLSLRHITFLRPYAVLMLACLGRYLCHYTGARVRLANLSTDVHAYLENMHLFGECRAWLYTGQELPPNHRLGEDPRSSRLLRMMPIRSREEVYLIKSRTREIFSTWLSGFPEDTLDDLVSVVVELCNNVRDHSRDTSGGLICIQSYRHSLRHCFEVALAVVDMGIGIPKSLGPKFSPYASTAEEFITLALQGCSSRDDGKGGDGLPTVCEIVRRYGGSVAIRAENGMVVVFGGRAQKAHAGLGYFPGTQIQVQLKSRIARAAWTWQ